MLHLDPVNISPLPAGTMLGFVSRGHYWDTARCNRKELLFLVLVYLPSIPTVWLSVVCKRLSSAHILLISQGVTFLSVMYGRRSVAHPQTNLSDTSADRFLLPSTGTLIACSPVQALASFWTSPASSEPQTLSLQWDLNLSHRRAFPNVFFLRNFPSVLEAVTTA